MTTEALNTPRLNMMDIEVAAEGMSALQSLEGIVRKSSLSPDLLDLVRTRASQINWCAFCINMHTREARERGESEKRLYMLNAWRESDLYSDRERAALAWTESLTLISQTHAPQEVFDELADQFTQEEIATLSLGIVAINSWNRLAVGFRVPPAD